MGNSVNEVDMNPFLTQLTQDTQPEQTDIQAQLLPIQERIAELEAWKAGVARMLNPPDTLSLAEQLQLNITTVTNLYAVQIQLATTMQLWAAQLGQIVKKNEELQERVSKYKANSQQLSEMLVQMQNIANI